MIKGNQVAAVIPTFRGVPERVLVPLRSQVGEIIVVDNRRVNRGVATALNIGFDLAIRRGYRAVLCLDDDTVVGGTLVETLLAILQHTDSLKRRGDKPGIVAANGRSASQSLYGGPVIADMTEDGVMYVETRTPVTRLS